jgi:hypothetical protein
VDPATAATVLRGKALGNAYRNEPTIFEQITSEAASSGDPIVASDDLFRIGLGLGLGILLMFGLTLGVRATRHARLAH